MRREKGTTYALPKAFWEKREGKIHDYNGKLSCLFRIYLSVKTHHVETDLDFYYSRCLRIFRM
jgi:hypothetical protein